MSHRRFPSMTGLVLLQLALLAVCGCVQKKPTGRIAGAVTYKGQPVGSGTVNLIQRETGSAASAPLDSAGQFVVEAPISTGTYTVSITPPLPKQLPPGSPPEEVPPFLIPMEYQDSSQSRLNVEVEKGENDVDIVVPEK